MGLKPLIIGHRGCPISAPENSMEGFQKAIELGADGIEFDVRLTKDRIPVIIHDATIDRTTDGKGRVSGYTLAELKKFSLDNKETIPTLKQALKLKIGMRIELKDDCGKEVVKLLRKRKDTAIISFSKRQIRELKYVRKGALMALFVLPQKSLDRIGAHLAVVNKRLITKNLTKRISHVCAWTVNSEKDIRKMIRYGVEEIFTDDVELAVKTRQNYLNQ